MKAVKNLKWKLVLLTLIVGANSAYSAATERVKKEKVPDIHESFKGHKWWAGYSAFVKSEILKDEFSPLYNIEPKQVKSLCPNYAKLGKSDKQNFWNVFFMALAHAESGFDHHSRPCAGIMQLTCSKNARIGYKCKLCDSNSTLRKKPLIGVQCAMKIITHWAKRGKLVDTRHPYFEVLRPNRHYRNKVKPSILKYAPEKCGNGSVKVDHLDPAKEKEIEL